MSKFILLFFLLLVGYQLCGQTPEIRKSTDIIVIKGKNYYLHVVEQGQTLFSICKAYGVDVEEVKALNKKQGNELSVFEVLKIPYVAPYVQQDGEYYYHKVVKGETLYSISRKFGIKVKRILRENKTYENTPLSIGAIVRLPLRAIDISQIREEKGEGVDGNPDEKIETTEVSAEEGENESGKKDTLTIDTLPLIIDHSVPENKYVKVALLLPLFAQQNVDIALMATDTTGGKIPTPVSVLHKSEQFVYFYEGILLAVDSLKQAGYKIDLHVFDTEKSNTKMNEIVAALNKLNPDLIIGPVYGSEYRILMENLLNKQIPVVYPLSARNENFGQDPNFLQVNISFASLIEKMIYWIGDQRASANIIGFKFLQDAGNDEQTQKDRMEKKMWIERLETLPGVRFFNWDFRAETLEGLKLMLSEEQENILILPTSRETDLTKILPVLSLLKDAYKITVVGFPDWQNFTSIDHENFYKLNVKLFTYSYVDNYAEEAKNFAAKYREYFDSEPHTLTNKAYDLGLYFIPLAARFGVHFPQAFYQADPRGVFSVFRFERMCPGCGWENRGLYIVNYGSDYKIKVEVLQ